ncbi:helix-turn-helix domain-containing protein [uncultured Polaribacter sp.]|uniref:helix-turn-helix domain-containing protein n=1 Tax=uncultured Polaribacter sp. TaxID=174711 RepID=UPI00261DC4CB|nr:helix-turn-helix domain-containing protein [uncultured Polaribacter sp.]
MSSNIYLKKTCIECGNQFIARTTVTLCCSGRCRKRIWKRKQREKKIKKAIEVEEKTIPQHIKNSDLKGREIFSILQASKFIGVSKSTIYRLFDDGKLKKVKIRSRIFITRNNIEKAFKI